MTQPARYRFRLYVDELPEGGWKYTDFEFSPSVNREKTTQQPTKGRFSKAARIVCHLLAYALYEYKFLSDKERKLRLLPVPSAPVQGFDLDPLRELIADPTHANSYFDSRIDRQILSRMFSINGDGCIVIHHRVLDLAGSTIHWRHEERDLSTVEISRSATQLVPASVTPSKLEEYGGNVTVSATRRNDMERVITAVEHSFDSINPVYDYPRPILIYGVPGIGKTALIQSIRHDLEELAETSVAWIRAKKGLSAESLLQEVADKLQVPFDEYEGDVANRISIDLGSNKAIVVVDNCHDPMIYTDLIIPNSSVLTLIISRSCVPNEELEYLTPIKLDVLKAQEAQILLLDKLDEKCRLLYPDIESAIVSRLPLVPQLLLSLVGRLNSLASTPEITSSLFCDLVSGHINRYIEHSSYGRNKSADPYMEHIESLSPVCQAAMAKLSVLATRPSYLHPTIAKSLLGDDAPVILTELVDACVLEFDEQKPGYSLHDVFAQAVKTRTPPDQITISANAIAQHYKNIIKQIENTTNDPSAANDQYIDWHLAHMAEAAEVLRENGSFQGYYDLTRLQCILLNASSKWGVCLESVGKQFVYHMSECKNFHVPTGLAIAFHLAWPAWMTGQYEKCRLLLQEAEAHLNREHDQSDPALVMKARSAIYHNYHKLSIMELNSSGHLLNPVPDGDTLLRNTCNYADLCWKVVVDYEKDSEVVPKSWTAGWPE